MKNIKLDLQTLISENYAEFCIALIQYEYLVDRLTAEAVYRAYIDDDNAVSIFDLKDVYEKLKNGKETDLNELE